ncbi:MAG TPA: Uma2 family endonuclease [Labilithrix sp.]|nr:Uma2 family endonuclease [Labilithrix sp.]
MTVDVLDTLPEEQRVEVIDGELVYEAMTSFDHGEAQLSLGGAIKSRFGGGGPDGKSGWWIATEVTVIYAVDQGFRHDVVGWRKSRVPARPKGRRVTMRPDWVCEILSTNKRKDLVLKRRVLHEKGVPHYWILDPDGKTLSIFRWHADGYLLVTAVSPGDRAALEPFDVVEFDVTNLFGDLEPESEDPEI